MDKIKKSFREDVYRMVIYDFREQHSKSMFNLGFSFCDFMFGSFYFTGDELDRRGLGVGFKVRMFRLDEQSYEESVLRVGFRRVVWGLERDKLADSFWVNHIDGDRVRDEERGEGDMVSGRGFKGYDRLIERFENREEGLEVVRIHGKRAGGENFVRAIDDTEIKRGRRYINTNKHHDTTSKCSLIKEEKVPYNHSPGWQRLDSLTKRLGIKGQRDILLMRLRAYEEWGLCHSFVYLQHVPLNKILY